MGQLAKKSIAVAVSGGGRSLRNLLQHQVTAPWQVSAVISSNPNCGANEIAREFQIPTFHGDFSAAARESTAKKLQSFLQTEEIDLIVLAGFLKLFPSLPGYKNHVINIHPALLPKYGGKGMHGHHVHEAVIAAKEPISGATVHFVNEQYDEGSIIAQVEVPVTSLDTPETLASNVFAAECKLLPWTISELCLGHLPLPEGQIKKMELTK